MAAAPTGSQSSGVLLPCPGLAQRRRLSPQHGLALTPPPPGSSTNRARWVRTARSSSRTSLPEWAASDSSPRLLPPLVRDAPSAGVGGYLAGRGLSWACPHPVAQGPIRAVPGLSRAVGPGRSDGPDLRRLGPAGPAALQGASCASPELEGQPGLVSSGAGAAGGHRLVWPRVWKPGSVCRKLHEAPAGGQGGAEGPWGHARLLGRPPVLPLGVGRGSLSVLVTFLSRGSHASGHSGLMYLREVTRLGAASWACAGFQAWEGTTVWPGSGWKASPGGLWISSLGAGSRGCHPGLPSPVLA